MGATYIRQSSYTDGDVITAAHTNDEFNALLAAFVASTGHTHDGTAAEGGPITKLLGTAITIGNGTAGTDIAVTFDGETNDGVLTWMEDEDYFKFSDDILMNSTEKLQFGDTASFIQQSSDGVLRIDGEATVDINASTAVTISNDLKLDSDSAVLGFGADNDTTLTHTDGTGLTLNSTNKLTFGDVATFVQQSSNGVLRIDGEATVDINASTAVLVSNDLKLDSDAAVLGMGADNDVTLTHVADTGLLLNSTRQLQFGDSGTYIHQSADGVLDLVSDTEIEINATTIDMNGAVDVSGNLSVGGDFDVTGTIDFSDSAITNAGSIQLDSIAGDADSNTSITFSGSDVITVANAGTNQVTFNDGSVAPVTDSDVDLGTSSLFFKDAFIDKITTTGNIELGHASDTTIARSGAGAITVEGTAVLLAGAQTGVTTDFNASRKVGRDADNLIDFATTDNKIILRVEGVNEVELVQNALSPVTSDGVALGTSSLMWSDAFLASGSVINFNNGDVTLTHSANTLTLGGGNLAVGSNNITSTGTVTFGSISDGTITATAFVDEDDMSSDSATLIPTQQSVKAYVDNTSSMGSGFVIEDDDGTEVTITENKEIKVIGSGVTTNWTDTDNGTDGDPYDLTITVDAAQTGITSLLATNIKIGEDDQTKIDFETADEIHFYAANAEQVYVADGVFGPQTDSDVDLGTNSVRWKDAYLDTVNVSGASTLTGNVTLGGQLIMPDVTDAKILVADGTSYQEVAVSGDVTIANTGAITIAANAVQGSMLNTDVISAQTALTSGLATTDELLVSDAGTLKRMDVSVLTAVTDDNATALAIALG